MESSEEASCQPRCCGGQIREALELQTAAAEEGLSPGTACRRRLGSRNSQTLSGVMWKTHHCCGLMKSLLNWALQLGGVEPASQIAAWKLWINFYCILMGHQPTAVLGSLENHFVSLTGICSYIGTERVVWLSSNCYYEWHPRRWQRPLVILGRGYGLARLELGHLLGTVA